METIETLSVAELLELLSEPYYRATDAEFDELLSELTKGQGVAGVHLSPATETGNETRKGIPRDIGTH